MLPTFGNPQIKSWLVFISAFLLLSIVTKSHVGGCIVRHRTIFIHLSKSSSRQAANSILNRKSRIGCCSSLNLEFHKNEYILTKDNYIGMEGRQLLYKIGNANRSTGNITLYQGKNETWMVENISSNL